MLKKYSLICLIPIMLSCSYLVHHSQDIILNDIDGNAYRTVKIGEQVWMGENLRVTHFQNGDEIPRVRNTSKWVSTGKAAYCCCNGDTELVATYGLLYNCFAVTDSRNIAPKGWHVPTMDDWKTLDAYLKIRGVDSGGALKEPGNVHWKQPNKAATNETGFSALPAGFRAWGNGGFQRPGQSVGFWVSAINIRDKVWGASIVSLDYNKSILHISEGGNNLKGGLSIRLIRD